MDWMVDTDLYFENSTVEFNFSAVRESPQNQTSPNPGHSHNMTTDSHCTLYGEPLVIFLMAGVGVSFLSLIGFIGNILSMIVLTRPAMRSSSTNIILLGLSFSDLVFVIIAFIFYGLPGFLEYFCLWPDFSNTISPVILPPLFPLISIAQICSVYFTVSVTVERFFVVYRPLKARAYCTVKNAVWSSLIICIFAIIFTAPTWWELSYEDNYTNGTWTGYTTTVTALRKDPDYVFYYLNWSCLIVYRLIPFAILSVLNVSIYIKIRTANKLRQSMTQSESNEISIAKMLVCIVSIFLLCNCLRIYLSMKEAFTRTRNSAEMITLSGLFLTLNSAINFIIYCLLGKKFRDTCLQLFYKRTGPGSRNQSLGSTHVTTKQSVNV